MKEINYTRTKSDINGNPRYIVHFLDLLTEKDNFKVEQMVIDGIIKPWDRLEYLKAHALYWARKVGGKIYRGKDYGGGIVFTSYDIEGDLRAIRAMQEREEA